MTDDEADDLFGKLATELRGKRDRELPSERDDFLKAIEAEIDAGKPVPVTLKVRSEKIVPDALKGSRRAEATSSGEFIQRQEYTAKEKLEILLNGLALATVVPPLMAHAFVTETSRLSENVASAGILLGDDQTVDPLQSLQTTSVGAAVQGSLSLRTILEEIRREILNSDDPAPSTSHV